MRPYYEQDGITIYHGDCRSFDVWFRSDVLITDPPYPDYHALTYRYDSEAILMLDRRKCRQFVFWSAKVSFPLSHTAIHIWDKKTGCGSEYERLFERNGQANWKVFRHYLINSSVAASYQSDEWTGHPSQKPERLMRAVIDYGTKHGELILDPFMGSGTTLVAAKRLGRPAIGIEIEERYCEIAAKRLAQGALMFGSDGADPAVAGELESGRADHVRLDF